MFISSWSSEAIVFFVSALPIGELRAALPIALVKFKLPLVQSILIVLAGNMIPVAFIFGVLPAFERLVARIPPFNGWLQRYYAFVKLRHVERFRRFGWFFLIPFVAIPLPGSGAWTAALIAYLLKLDAYKSALAIFLGLCGSVVFIFLVTTGALKLFL